MNDQKIRDLFLVREGERQALERKAREVVKAWASEWLPDTTTWAPQLETACATEASLHAPHDNWFAQGAAGVHEAQAWSAAVSDATVPRLAAMLLGRESHTPLSDTDWAMQSAKVALNDLHARMLGAPLTGSASKPDLQRLSGAVMVCERSLGLTWVWSRSAYAPMANKATALPPAQATAALTAGLGAQRVQVSAGLGEVEIDMSELMALQMGDVIRFPSKLKGPILVDIGAPGHAKHAAQAQLGQRDGHVAIKLTSKSSAA